MFFFIRLSERLAHSPAPDVFSAEPSFVNSNSSVKPEQVPKLKYRLKSFFTLIVHPLPLFEEFSSRILGVELLICRSAHPDELPIERREFVLSQNRFEEPESELVPFQNVTCPDEPEPVRIPLTQERLPAPSVRSTLLVAP